MKIFLVGDVHIKSNNLPYISIYIARLEQVLQTSSELDIIILMGDILHDHERVSINALNYAYNLIEMLMKKAKLYIIVGNHDYINNRCFLNDSHWMNALKKWSNVIVVDRVLKVNLLNNTIVLLPYVPPGRFIEALDTVDDWKSASMIFAHQEFKGCKLGAIFSELGDEWDLNNPMIFSGHIHEMYALQRNIYYTGASTQVSFGEQKCGNIIEIDFNDSIVYNTSIPIAFEPLDLKLPKKQILHVKLEDFVDLEIDLDHPQFIKIKLFGEYSNFKKLKKNKKFKKFEEIGIKMTYCFEQPSSTPPTESFNTSDFLQLLQAEINMDPNQKQLNAFYTSLI